jgi:hypothetical protein
MKQKLTGFLSTHWDAILASIAGSLFIYFFTRHSGIGISPDSVVYQATAENIRSHFSFRDFNNMPLVDFPLGYPTLLALASFLSGSSVLAVAPVLNALLFSGVIIMTSVIISGYRNSSRWFKMFFLTVIACSPVLLEVYCNALVRNPVHLPGTIIHNCLPRLSWRASQGTVMGDDAGRVCCHGNPVCRHLPAADRHRRYPLRWQLARRRKIKRLLVFTSVGLSLFICNLIRNYLIAGSLTGVRETASRSLGDNIAGMAATIADWFPFLQGYTIPAVIVLAAIFCLALYMRLGFAYCSSNISKGMKH